MSSHSERKWVIALIFSVVVMAFISRLFYIQIMDESYKLTAKNQAFRYDVDYPTRGNMFDRNGKQLVFNQAAYDLMVIPKQAKNIDTLELCILLGITKENFLKRMLKAIQHPNSSVKPSIFEKEISIERSSALQEKIYRFNGFFLQPRTLRKYMFPIAAHVLGYIGEVDEKMTDTSVYYRMGDYIGISGIEKSYEVPLRGKRGTKITMVDVHNRPKGSFMDGIYDTAAVSGLDLQIALDADLQEYGEKLLQNKIGSIVAIEPGTGEILCVVTSPTYDPGLLVGNIRSKNFAKLALDTIYKPLFNRALKAKYPPGSTFKLVMSLIGQNELVLFPQTGYYCDGGYHIGSQTVKCDAIHGTLSLLPGIAHSCNTYFCNVFRSVIENRKYNTTEEAFEVWRKYVLSFGIGKKLGLDLPYENSGSLPTVSYYNKYFGKQRWRSSTIISLSIGQGELGIPPLQNANVICVIANKGFYYTPHIVKTIGNNPNDSLLNRFKEKNYALVTDTAFYNIVIQGMSQVVEHGTAAASKIHGIEYCGKTGTVQNPHGKDHSVFVAFAPKENPRIAIAVTVENAGWGSQWAAPIASLMIEKYLRDSTQRPEIEKRMMEGIVLPETK